MKRFIARLAGLVLLIPVLVQCSKYDDSWIRSKFSEIDAKLATLENNINSLNAYKTIVDNLQKGKTIDHIADNGDGSFSIWYVGDTTPVVIKTTPGEKGDPGDPGTPGVTPDFKIEDGDWYVSYDQGKTWTKLGSASSNESLFFKNVRVDGDVLVLILIDGTEVRINLLEGQGQGQGQTPSFSDWVGTWSVHGQYDVEIVDKDGTPGLLFGGKDLIPLALDSESGKMLLRMPGEAVWSSGDRADWVVLYSASDNIVNVEAGTLLSSLSLSEDKNTVTLTTADAGYGYIQIRTYDYAQGKYVEDKDVLTLGNETLTRKAGSGV